MSFELVRHYFETLGMADRILVLDQSSATVEKAAQALHCEEKQIAKTMSFLVGDDPIVVVCAGDARIHNHQYKMTFHKKAKMIPASEVEALIGHAPGGVCPFALKDNVKVYLDISLKRFEFVYPAAGSGHSAVKLTIPELESTSHALEWVDVCKDWQDENSGQL